MTPLTTRSGTYDEAEFEESLILETTREWAKTAGPMLVMLIRHTEKPADPNDPHLTMQGKRHALALAQSIPAQYGAPHVVFAAAIDMKATAPYKPQSRL